MTDDNGQTLVAYDLTVVPSFSVPGALLSRLLKRDSAAMIMQLRREIGRSICHADGRSLQRVVRHWRCTETGEASRGQGATTENTGSI